VIFLSNRGANGIDGLLASGCGAAAATRKPVTVITGDLAFQHDLGSLALLAASAVPVTVLVVNDGGGRIFSRLPQKSSMPDEEFETLMRTPGRLDIASAAAMFGVRHVQIKDPEHLKSELRDDSSTRILEVAIAVD
jgi:2-succinyl-5-enolpyruvyl-6-hydroxy-3-cyclohexene-1-carboxylate synthase